ncbi:MAG TPA: DUF5994 family protein [Nocardioides sp.]|nr:DUF5994 family protein [Nocardioides sp.]
MASRVDWPHCEHQVTHQGPGPRPGWSTESDRRSNRRRWPMATLVTHPRFAPRPVFDRLLPDGAWWPENRRLSDPLGGLFAYWPPERGRIAQVPYSRPDRSDPARSVPLAGRAEQQPARDDEGGHF